MHQDNLCPITYLQILPASVPITNATGQIKLSDQEILYFWRSLGQGGVFWLSVGVDGFPCLSLQKEPIYGPKYPLYDTELGCGEYGADSANSEEIARSNFSAFLNQSEAFQNIIRLPGFYAYANQNQAILFQRRQFQYNLENSLCKGFSDLPMQNVEVAIQDIRFTALVFLITKLMFGGPAFVLLVIQLLFHGCKFDT